MNELGKMGIGFGRSNRTHFEGCRRGVGVENGAVLTEAKPKRSQETEQPRLFVVFDVVVDLLADAVEDVAVAFFERGAGDDAAERAEERIGVALMRSEADLGEGGGQVFQQRFDFVDGGEVVARFGNLAHAGEIDFVGEKHHGLREVQGWMLGGLRDADDVVAETQFGIGKAGFFATEHDSDPVFVGKLGDFRGGLSGFDDLGELGAAFAVGGADEPVEAVGGFFPSGHVAGVLQQIAGAVPEHDRLHVRLEIFRAVEDDEVREAHRFHGAGGGADVARDGGFDEDDGDVGEVARRGEREGRAGIFFVGFTHANRE